MHHDPEQLRHELTHLVNEQADTAEKGNLTDRERRVYQERQNRINELCDKLRHIATHTGLRQSSDRSWQSVAS
jgi:hypothetical protein